MCQDCGCGKPGPTRIDGVPAEEIASPLLDAAETGAAVAHRHPHTHAHAHAHTHDHAGVEAHAHGHAHAHEHEHEHTHSHEAGHEHDHRHDDDSAHAHEHGGGTDHAHEHMHAHGSGHQVVLVNQPVLAANDRVAERNRGYFKALGLLVMNVVSSPGSGKTTLIQQTVVRLGSRLRAGVIVGDLETDNDARRLRESGARAVQITTGTLCHLEAGMIARAMTALDPRALDVLIIENVGNLVCPAAFDLGEELRVVVLSVTEGEDKPLKYPPIFHAADAVIVSKVDLAEAVGISMELLRTNIRRASPRAKIFEVSAKTGVGLDEWCDYLDQRKRSG
jgi:hydrogenase nickel incorporation protein HypB